jgi:hypothetical protein
MIDYIHDTPGRLRVRCSALRKDQTKAAALKTHLAAVAGVTAVEVSQRTGSVTTHYNPAATRAAVLMNIMEAHGLQPALAPAAVNGNTGRRPVRAKTRNGHGMIAPPALAKAAAGFLIEKAIERSLMAIVAAVL